MSVDVLKYIADTYQCFKDKCRVQSAVMTEEKRKKGEEMLRWIEQRSMGN